MKKNDETSYHQSQLKRLMPSEYNASVKVFDGNGNSTNQMDLNQESIPILIKYLEAKLEDLKRVETKSEVKTK
jgi:hypothetical protein